MVVKTDESIATWWGLRLAKVYFSLKVVYKAHAILWWGGAV